MKRAKTRLTAYERKGLRGRNRQKPQISIKRGKKIPGRTRKLKGYYCHVIGQRHRRIVLESKKRGKKFYRLQARGTRHRARGSPSEKQDGLRANHEGLWISHRGHERQEGSQSGCANIHSGKELIRKTLMVPEINGISLLFAVFGKYAGRKLIIFT